MASYLRRNINGFLGKSKFYLVVAAALAAVVVVVVATGSFGIRKLVVVYS